MWNKYNNFRKKTCDLNDFERFLRILLKDSFPNFILCIEKFNLIKKVSN